MTDSQHRCLHFFINSGPFMLVVLLWGHFIIDVYFIYSYFFLFFLLFLHRGYLDLIICPVNSMRLIMWLCVSVCASSLSWTRSGSSRRPSELWPTVVALQPLSHTDWAIKTRWWSTFQCCAFTAIPRRRSIRSPACAFTNHCDTPQPEEDALPLLCGKSPMSLVTECFILSVQMKENTEKLQFNKKEEEVVPVGLIQQCWCQLFMVTAAGGRTFSSRGDASFSWSCTFTHCQFMPLLLPPMMARGCNSSCSIRHNYLS